MDLSVSQAAGALGKHPMTVRRWAQEGRIPARKVGGHWRVSAESVREMTGRGGEHRPSPEPRLFSEWLRRHLPAFKDFVERAYREFAPDVVVIHERKARLYDSLGLIPEDTSQSTIYASALPWSPALREPKGKRVLILEESVQRGARLERLRAQLEEKGAIVRSIALIRRRALFETGVLKEPRAVPCLDLDEEEFAYATSQIALQLDSEILCLDVDHFPSCQFELQRQVPFETLAQALASLGQLFIHPLPEPISGVWSFTIDNPYFFELMGLPLPPGLRSEGVCKFRVYYDARHPLPRLYIVPVVFPALRIEGRDLDRITQVAGEAWARYVVLPEGWETLPERDKAELLFRYLSVFASTQLLLKALPLLWSLGDAIGIERGGKGLSIDDTEVLRTLGQSTGGRLAKKVEEDVVETWTRLTATLPLNPSVRQARLQPPSADAKEETMEALVRALDAAIANEGREGLSRTELLERLGWSEAGLSRMFDFGLDRGLLRPQNEVRRVEGGYEVRRVYAPTEYGSWFKGSAAYTNERYAARKIAALIPYIINRLMQGDEDLREGVPSITSHKVLTNLQHDWVEVPFDRLYLGWNPYFFGPIPFVPEVKHPIGGFKAIGDFTIEQRACEYRTTRDGRKVLVPYRGGEWMAQVRTILNGIERDYVDGLVDVYGAIYRWGKSTDPLVTLAACRTRELTYICAHEDLSLWRDHIEKALEAIELRTPNCRYHLDRANWGRTQLVDKLNRYENLASFANDLQGELANHHRSSLVDQLLQRLELPATISEDEPFPLAPMRRASHPIDHFTTLVQLIATRLDLVADRRTSTKRDRTCEFYLDRLVESSPALVDEEVAEPIKKADMGGSLEDAVLALRTLHRRLIREISQIQPPQIYGDVSGQPDSLLAGILETGGSGEETGHMLLDILGFVAHTMAVADESGASQEEIALNLRREIAGQLNKVVAELDFPQDCIQEVGGDGWLVCHKDVESLLQAACRLQLIRRAQSPSIRIAITFGSSMLGTIGDRMSGQASIRAYYLAEKSNLVAGGVRLDAEAAALVRTPHLKALLEPLPDPLRLDRLGECHAVDVHVAKFSRQP